MLRRSPGRNRQVQGDAEPTNAGYRFPASPAASEGAALRTAETATVYKAGFFRIKTNTAVPIFPIPHGRL